MQFDPKSKKFAMSEDEYASLSENNGGACLACGEDAYDPVEPDARGYKCHGCGKLSVYGIEELMVMGRIEFA